MRSRRRTKFKAAAGTIGLILAIGLPAQSVTLFKFKGTVRDAIGRPLAGATVDDGAKKTTTAANGAYTLNESSTGRYTLKSFRSDTNTVTKTVDVQVPIDQTVDFSLAYKISGTLSRAAISTAQGPQNAQLTVTSYAPSPGSPGEAGGKSCVYVTDTRTNQTTAATFVSASNGTSTWTHDLSLAQGTAQGSYGLQLAAKDCAGGTVLTPSPAPVTGYVIDNTAPSLLLDSILPTNLGNTMFTSQRLFAKATDQGGSGLGTSSYTMTDLATGQTSSPSGTFDGTWLKTVAPVSLTQGHEYRVTLKAHDNAGNTDSETIQFLASSASANAASAIIPLKRVTMSPTAATSRTITFPNVALKVNPTVVHLGPSAHPGFGYVQQQVVIRQAKVTYYVGSVKVGETTPTSNIKSKDRIVFRQFVDSEARNASRDIKVGPKTVGIGSIDAAVPGSATSAELSLNVTVPVSMVTCADPSVGLPACSPDPVRFFLPDEIPTRMGEVQTAMVNPCVPCQGLPPNASYELIMLLVPANGKYFTALPPVPVAERYYGWIEWPEWTLPADEWATACSTNFRCVHTPTSSNAAAQGPDNDGHVRYSHVSMTQFVWGEGVNGDPVEYGGFCGPNQQLAESCLHGFYGASNSVYYEAEDGNTYWGAAGINGRDVLDGIAINFSGGWMNPVTWGSGGQQHYIDQCGFGSQSRPLLYTNTNHAAIKYAQWRGGGYGCDGKGYISWAAGVGIQTIKPQFENQGGGFVMRWEHLHQDWEFDFTFSLGLGGPSIGTNPQESTQATHVYSYEENCCVF